MDYSEDEADFAKFAFANHLQTNAQLMQDILVLYLTKVKRNGVFIEIGAADGRLLSNTLLLEEAYDWTGILAEPARGWHRSLSENRRCRIDYRCVADVSGEKRLFRETNNKVYSTLLSFHDQDGLSHERDEGQDYEVETISLNDLCLTNNVNKLDYLSIDTEGSELIILEAFNFTKYLPTVVTVEHNFKYPERQQIYELMTHYGYKRKFERLSHWDDWYVIPEKDT